jgi:hypothetical protein
MWVVRLLNFHRIENHRMSLLKRLFGGRSTEDDKMALVQQMEAMATEAERVYRNFVKLYADENDRPTAVTGRGLFKARLHAAIFMVQPFVMRWPGKQDDAMELTNIASGVARTSLVEPNSDPRLDQNEAKAFAIDYMKRVIIGITSELKTGPSIPNHETQGFRDLAELYHDALRDSIGSAEYTPDVEARFDHLVKSGIMSGLRHITEVADNL